MDNKTDNTLDGYLEAYLFEENSLLEQLENMLIGAEKDTDLSEDDVNEIFRIMHTIKGSSAAMNFNSLMEIAHHIEDLFFFIRENGMSSLDSDQKTDLFDLMFKSTDFLKEEIEKVENGEPLEENIDSFIKEINLFLQRISNFGTETEESSVSVPDSSCSQIQGSPFTDETPHCIRIFFEEGCGMENLRAYMLITSLTESNLTFVYSPQNVETDSSSSEEIIANGFLLGFATEEDAVQASKVIESSSNIHSYEVFDTGAAYKAVKEEEKATPTSSKSPSTNTTDSTPSKTTSHSIGKQNLISVNLSKLDTLMALVGEIVITESMVTSSPDLKGLKLDDFMKSARQLRKLTDDLQDISMSLRMVSVSGVFQKMNRIVRDMNKALDKNVGLTLVGEDTELDKTIVDSISDPLMHIVRNSMDHGIESTQDRINAGKNPQGEIVLSATHTGNEIVISVTDDGQGVDTEKVLEKARKNNFLTKSEHEYTQKEILALLMEPGFSTNSEVTEFSGRGVGMDVVKKNIEAIGGSVLITSEAGKGTCTSLKIPLTLAIVDGMEISIGKSIFTIPIANIRQSFKASSEDVVYDASGHELIKCMNEFYPVIRLYNLFGIHTDVCTNIEDGVLMWVESSDISYCLFIDRLIGEQQVVVKPLPSCLNVFGIKDYGISGCTILGDGNISIILDIANIYHAVKKIY